jgi:outer membrane protein
MRERSFMPRWLVACLLVGPSAAAQEGDALHLSLAEAVERGRTASAGLAQLRALEQATSADVRGARAGQRPQLGLFGGYTRASDVPELILTLPGQPARPIFPNLPDNYRARLELSLPLYTGGRVRSQIAAAEHESAAATSDLKAADADLVLEVSAAYWSLVTAEASARVLGESLAAFDAHLKDALDRERFGMAARNEVLAVRVERDRAELARLRAQNGAAASQAELARLLDLPAATRVIAAEPLERHAAAAPEPSALVASALGARADRAALASRLSAAEARVAVERSARLPQANAAAGYDYANPNREILPPSAEWRHTWDVSLNLSLSVFDGGRAGAAVARARARAEAARQVLSDFDRRVRLQVTRALLDLQSAEAAVAVAERGLEAAVENLRVSSERYREGVIPSSERLDAEVALQRAGLDRTEALAQARLAEAGLARAVGR